jgi:hypothetical protein
MSSLQGQRIFEISIDWGFGSDSAHFYEDGTMLPADRATLLAELEGLEGDEAHVATLEHIGRENLFTILKAEAEYVAPTPEQVEAQRKAAWIAQQQKETKEYLDMAEDLRAWDNDSDESHRGIHWNELARYD